MNMTEDEKMTIDGKLGQEVETPKLDITPFVGVKTKVHYYEIGSKTFTNKDGSPKKSYFVTFFTEKLGDTPDGEPIKASKLFGLKKGEGESNFNWSSQSKLAYYLKAKGVNHPDDLIGMEVTTKASEPDKNGQEWLTF